MAKYDFGAGIPKGTPWQERVRKPEGELLAMVERVIHLDGTVREQAMELAMILEEIEFSEMYRRQGLTSMSRWIWWLRTYRSFEPDETRVATYCAGVRLWVRELRFDPGHLAAHFHVHALGQLAKVLKGRVSDQNEAKALLDELRAEGITAMLRKYSPQPSKSVDSPNRSTWVDSMHNGETMYRETLAEEARFLDNLVGKISPKGPYRQIRGQMGKRARHLRSLLESNHGKPSADEMRACGQRD